MFCFGAALLNGLALAVTSVRRNLDGSNADLPWAIGCKLMVSVGMCLKLDFLGGIFGLTVPVGKCCPKFELLCGAVSGSTVPLSLASLAWVEKAKHMSMRGWVSSHSWFNSWSWFWDRQAVQATVHRPPIAIVPIGASR